MPIVDPIFIIANAVKSGIAAAIRPFNPPTELAMLLNPLIMFVIHFNKPVKAPVSVRS